MSYTPGPWKVQHLDGCSRVFTKTKIADVYSEAFRDKETQIANACLMYAAPELLEALKACHLQMLQSSNDSDYAQEANQLAIAAIAKAEGKL